MREISLDIADVGPDRLRSAASADIGRSSADVDPDAADVDADRGWSGRRSGPMSAARGAERGTWLLLVGILALALLLRMGWPTLAEFKRDEATVAHRALAIAYEGHRPAKGVDTSTGTANLPLMLYLLAIPLRLWRDVAAAVLFVGLLNGLAVWACYAVGRAYFGAPVGLVAAFLFAVNPWAVLYGRKIWSQNLPLFTLGFFAALCATFVRGKRWALVGVFVGLAALIGLHLGGLAFVPVLLIPMLLYRKQVAWLPLVIGGLLFALAVSPYIVHDALHGWPSARSFLNYAGGEARFSWDALRYAFHLVGSEGIYGMAGGLYPEYLAGLPNLWWFNWVMMGLLALALLYALVQIVRGSVDRRRSLILLLLWFAIPVLLQSRPTTPVEPHYFILLYPVQFLLVAIMLVDLSALFPRPALRLVGRRLPVLPMLFSVLMLLWGGWQIAVSARLLDFMNRHPTTGGYGIPLKYTRAAAREARQLAGPSDEIIVLSKGVNPAVDETPAVFAALLFDRPHRFADARWMLPLPDGSRSVYLAGPVEADFSDAEVEPILRRLGAMERTRVGTSVVLPDGWLYRLLYRDEVPRQDVLAGLSRFPEEIRFANGTAFLGYGLEETASPGGTLEVWLAWWVRALPPAGADYHFFVHLMDEEDALRSQCDVAGFPTASWRAGDLVLSRFSIPVHADLSTGLYHVMAGQYTYPDVVNVPFLDAAGNPAGDRVTLGRVSVTR